VRRPGVVRICDSLVSLALKRQDVAWQRVPQGWIRLQRLRRLRRRAILNAVWLARLEACMRPENPTRILGVPCSSVSSYLFAAKRPAAVCSHRPTGGSSAPGPMCGFIVCLTRAFLHLPLENHRWVLVISPRFPLPSFAFCPCGESCHSFARTVAPLLLQPTFAIDIVLATLALFSCVYHYPRDTLQVLAATELYRCKAYIEDG
jgi:hypothetical protein